MFCKHLLVYINSKVPFHENLPPLPSHRSSIPGNMISPKYHQIWSECRVAQWGSIARLPNMLLWDMLIVCLHFQIWVGQEEGPRLGSGQPRTQKPWVWGWGQAWCRLVSSFYCLKQYDSLWQLYKLLQIFCWQSSILLLILSRSWI
jgi:hypothetical protein